MPLANDWKMEVPEMKAISVQEIEILGPWPSVTKGVPCPQCSNTLVFNERTRLRYRTKHLRLDFVFAGLSCPKCDIAIAPDGVGAQIGKIVDARLVVLGVRPPTNRDTARRIREAQAKRHLAASSASPA